ncbi:uncharacterized protein LOC117644048 [Thrips palmi]|uniref:Uncharacterized protein LOC117644048 n=1 Tax=Thrips palmi TaxID=161013 RepID=A0A6P8YPF2_THRPL|nr:uncharacterized protein LOC117644048 [Thrips palmi]
MTATLTPIKLQLKQSESTSRTAAFNFSEECPDSQAGNSICTEPEMLTGSPEPGNMWRTQELKNLFGSEYGNSDQHKKPLQSLRNSAKEKNQLEAEVDTCHHADIPYVCSDIPSTDSDNQDCHNNACASENLGEYVSLHNVPKFMLPNDKLEKNTVVQLQNYLKSRKILPVPRLKADLIAKVKEVMALEPAPVSKPNVCNKKQQRLVLTKDVAQLPDDDVFPPTGWEVFPSRDMPSNFNFGSVFNYIVETMPQLPDPASNTPLADSSDEEDIAENVVIINDPFEDAEQTEIKCSKKLRRGLQYVKSKYVRNVHDCLPDRLHCYKGQVRASMSKVAYHVKVAIFQVSGSVVKASCHCGAHTMQRCSHISALLLYLLLHKNLNGPKVSLDSCMNYFSRSNGLVVVGG